jgi:hypothetical protein
VAESGRNRTGALCHFLPQHRKRTYFRGYVYRLGLPSHLNQRLPNFEKRSHLIASMCLLILSSKPPHLTAFTLFTSRGLKKVCAGIGAKSNPGPVPLFTVAQETAVFSVLSSPCLQFHASADVELQRSIFDGLHYIHI